MFGNIIGGRVDVVVVVVALAVVVVALVVVVVASVVVVVPIVVVDVVVVVVVGAFGNRQHTSKSPVHLRYLKENRKRSFAIFRWVYRCDRCTVHVNYTRRKLTECRSFRCRP